MEKSSQEYEKLTSSPKKLQNLESRQQADTQHTIYQYSTCMLSMCMHTKLQIVHQVVATNYNYKMGKQITHQTINHTRKYNYSS